jgi:hypothetical protein
MRLIFLTASLAFAVTAVTYAQTPASTPQSPVATTVNSTAPVLKGAEVPQLDVAMWTENGKAMVARGPDAKNAPKTATIFKVRPFALGSGGAIREVSIPKGGGFSPPKTTDTMVYMIKGHLKVKLGSVTAEVGPGDVFRKIALQDNSYAAVDDVVFVEAEAK